ncbi:hypothetical protein CMUS01_13547 [Colletotrichum musicola]|uniref:Uncharacterized protein n=1 Tax=Colletotrichum musicola TaxID=2175873 RepID=A0A8H6JCC9_9PEZI|nr:hypothetical protein CMUS01_13547 [Colletotrichum musicola]
MGGKGAGTGDAAGVHSDVDPNRRAPNPSDMKTEQSQLYLQRRRQWRAGQRLDAEDGTDNEESSVVRRTRAPAPGLSEGIGRATHRLP